MKKVLLAGFAMMTALAVAPAAMANSYDFTFTSGLTGGGVLTPGNTIGSNEFNITTGTISVSGGGSVAGSGNVIANPFSPATAYYYISGGDTIVNTQPPNASVWFAFDDILTPGAAAVFSGNGFAFKLGNGDLFDIWSVTSGSKVSYYWNEYTGTGNFDGWLLNTSGEGGDLVGMQLQQEVTPEPSSLLLLGTGLLCMAGFFLRKVKVGFGRTA
ncbi:MAG: PEP-CTERM sorting domain-containing protein [Terracidiphilus sp.]|jgi:hypothetical protein